MILGINNNKGKSKYTCIIKSIFSKPTLLIYLYIVCIFLMLGRFYVTNSVISGDGVYYYVNIKSILLDEDLNFKNDYEYFYNKTSPFTGNRKMPSIPNPDPITNMLPNKYPIGNVILLAPFFFIGHITTLALNQTALIFPPDGFNSLYQLSVGLGSLSMAFLGILLVYYLGKNIYGHSIALIGSVVIWLATPLIYYMTMEPLMSHSLSMFSVTLFVFIWYFIKDNRNLLQWAGLGIVGGMVSITRYQDGLFLLIPLIDAAYLIIIEKRISLSSIKYHVIKFCVFSLSFLAVFSIQLYVNKVLYGSPLKTGYIGEGFLFWDSPKLLYTLFSPQSGLLLWSPVLILSFLGLGMLAKSHCRFAFVLIISFLFQWYLVSSWSSVSQGDSFGNRMLINSTVIFAVGLMELIKNLKPNIQNMHYYLFSFLIIANAVLAGLYSLRIIGNPY